MTIPSSLRLLCADEECLRTLETALEEIMEERTLPEKAPEHGVLLIATAGECTQKHVEEFSPAHLLFLGKKEEAPPPLPSVELHLLEPPFRLGLFQETVRRIYAQGSARAQPLLPGIPVLLNSAARVLIHADTGAREELTEKESLLLAALARATAPRNRESLLAEVWNYTPEVETHTLETHISRLRARLHRLCGEHPAPLGIVLKEEGYCLMESPPITGQ
jgi:hypothetical protein